VLPYLEGGELFKYQLEGLAWMRKKHFHGTNIILGVLQRAIVCCSVLHRVASCCSVPVTYECVMSHLQGTNIQVDVLQRVAVCCSVLQCVAVCCSALQCVVVCYSVLHHDAVCCGVWVNWRAFSNASALVS